MDGGNNPLRQIPWEDSLDLEEDSVAHCYSFWDRLDLKEQSIEDRCGIKHDILQTELPAQPRPASCASSSL